MNDRERNKQVVQDFVQAIWRERDLDRLGEFWTADCLNHAHGGCDNRGLDALHSYHEGILSTLEAVSDVRLEIIQQIAEGDRVATHLRTTARHTAAFLSLPPSGAEVRLASIRIDRLQGGKIAEHWAIADTANLMSSAFS